MLYCFDDYVLDTGRRELRRGPRPCRSSPGLRPARLSAREPGTGGQQGGPARGGVGGAHRLGIDAELLHQCGPHRDRRQRRGPAADPDAARARASASWGRCRKQKALAGGRDNAAIGAGDARADRGSPCRAPAGGPADALRARAARCRCRARPLIVARRRRWRRSRRRSCICFGAPSGPSPTVASGARFDAASCRSSTTKPAETWPATPTVPISRPWRLPARAWPWRTAQPNAEAAEAGRLAAMQRQDQAAVQTLCGGHGRRLVEGRDARCPRRTTFASSRWRLPLVPDEIPTLDRERPDSIAQNAHEGAQPQGAGRHHAAARGPNRTRDQGRSHPAGARAVRRILRSVPACCCQSTGVLTIRIPKSRQVRSHLPAVDSRPIPSAPEERIGQNLSGRGMARARARQERQLARGRRRSVGGGRDRGRAESCAQADPECRLYAIGNFRVRDE